MKAFLLAAGKGTRLKPYTDTSPKCLIPIHGKPLLEIWLDLLTRHGITEVFINTHHHATKIEQFIEDIKPRVPLKIVSGYEQQLLGSAGTLLENRKFVTNNDDFIVAYSDNLTNINLSRMMSFHSDCKQKGSVLTMGLFRAPEPKACGIASLDKDQKIIDFTEKPSHPKSNTANSGIYIASQTVFDFFPKRETDDRSAFDLGHHVLPALVGNMYGYKIKEYLRDIGTLASYKQALEEWPTQT